MGNGLSVTPSTRELSLGWVYLLTYQLILPELLRLGNGLLPSPLTAGQMNFVFFCVNFACVAAIFHRFFLASGRQTHFRSLALAVAMGLLCYFAANTVITRLILLFQPEFSNVNDASIAAIAEKEYLLMAVGTVLLAPPVEEALFRGLIFGGLYRKSRVGAYLLSTVLFAAVHVTGYLGAASPVTLLLCFLQYLPAGLCLAGAYVAADSIFAPIVMHILINALGITSMR